MFNIPVESDVFPLWFNNTLGLKRYVHRNINERVYIHYGIALWKGKQMQVYIWQRDCDCAEWSQTVQIKNTYEAYIKLMDETYAGAEGPVSMHVMTPMEYLQFKPSSRDRIMEAFENGNSYNV